MFPSRSRGVHELLLIARFVIALAEGIRVAPGIRLKGTSQRLRKVLGDARIEGIRDVPRRVRRVLDVSESVVFTLEYIARSGLPGRPRENRVAAAEIVEHVARGERGGARSRERFGGDAKSALPRISHQA